MEAGVLPTRNGGQGAPQGLAQFQKGCGGEMASHQGCTRVIGGGWPGKVHSIGRGSVR